MYLVGDTLNDVLFTLVVGEVLKFSLFQFLIVLEKECHVFFFFCDL